MLAAKPKGAPTETIPKKVFLNKGQAKLSGGASSNNMKNHGGPVMQGTINVYLIWYGNWGTNTAPNVIIPFLSGLKDTAWWAITTTYYQGTTQLKYAGNPVYKNSTNVLNTYGTSLSNANIQQIVSDSITSGVFPSDTNGVYFVLTSAEVTASSGFCTSYCGWHNHGTIGGKDIKYSFVGNPDRCINSCAAQTTSPNGNAGADGMANIIAHELTETVTDPDLNGWYDASGQENADKCAWTFGTMQTTNGAKWNMQSSGYNYLIQQNWSLTRIACAMS
ncbi:unnamed protein product [Rotaria sp. Silwood1]|nr:unnamed protein product [Rotaria sp. Silwood1]CAF1077178.1 unnamed protein product [Rotaria sp. Silwood1]CAF3413509.1 unnamed protein product [Rotaria sp. Silwood1]CAF3438559.1 unnamed protein product [Rotaria sp. Silwood1]CAF3439298.1 unnamed protein product [Rotaria sp. Silwood1]